MKVKNIINIIVCILIGICFLSFYNISYAASGPDDAITGAESFIGEGSKEKSKIDIVKMQNMSDILFNTVLAIGTVFAVVFGTILGIQYMLASAEGKAQIKESIIPFVVGCVVMYSAFGIWKAIILVLK